MAELLQFLQQGRLDLFVVFGLLLGLAWVVKQWRQAEKDKDAIQQARLEDVRVMVALATEVKNNVTTLVKLIESGGRS